LVLPPCDADPAQLVRLTSGSGRYAQHLRIVDKVSVSPATTYIPPAFFRALEQHKDTVEYRQANLTIASVVAASFNPPEGRAPFSVVYDLTGEKAFDKAPIVRSLSAEYPSERLGWARLIILIYRWQIHMTSTLAVAILVGAEAERRNVRSFVRVCYPWYEMKGSEKTGYKENAKLVPDGDRGKVRCALRDEVLADPYDGPFRFSQWTHEALRALAAFPK
jgi:hypothetical protein